MIPRQMNRLMVEAGSNPPHQPNSSDGLATESDGKVMTSDGKVTAETRTSDGSDGSDGNFQFILSWKFKVSYKLKK